MTKRYYCAAVIMLIFISCSNKVVRHQFSVSEKKTIDELFMHLNRANSKKPETLTAKIIIDGTFEDKKYKSVGSVTFDLSSGLLNIVLYDFVFKTPLTTVIKNKESLSIYYPVEKKLILTKTDSIAVRRIMGINIDMKIILSLIEGTIPLINDYAVKQIYTQEDGQRFFLILENNKTYETISFKKNRPDRLLFIDKKGKEKIEVYIVKHYRNNNARYYKKLRIVAEQAKINLDVTFNAINMNKPVTILTEKDIHISRDTKIIRY